MIRLIFALIFSLTSFAAWADAMPEGATKLSSGDVKKIYVGKTAYWDCCTGYWSPDGKYKIVDKKKQWYAEGKWSVSGNTMCVKTPNSFAKDGEHKGGGACWKWVKDGKKLWSNWNRDGKGHPNDGWSDAEAGYFKKGDGVTKTIDALKAKWN